MEVKKIKTYDGDFLFADFIPALMDREGVEWHSVSNVNWADYPYRPKVRFRIAHTDKVILLHYEVTEASVRARYGEDNGSVWTDSCVEFFSMPGGDDIYYNLECNCAGTVLLAAGERREGREPAPLEVTKEIVRWSSLGLCPFEEKVGECTWQLALVVPYSVFFKHNIRSLDGVQVRANFYKCGDELQTPHFLSWNPIKTETPDFHCPQFFGLLEFE